MTPGTLIHVGGFELPDGNAAAHRVLANAKILRQLGYKVVLAGVRKSGGTGLMRYPESFEDVSALSWPQVTGVFNRHLLQILAA